ncbi:hypothetical protein F5883DRAFT_643295 [Diaporthe sp. PMI_573]|nr:hypothetical protein F5883DRAFT_643295 [Diaporthaceae sp. PMI_573]
MALGSASNTPFAARLKDFDFMDVATDEDPLWPRVATIDSRGRGWIDFARALHAITLFGTGFGELLQPSQGLGTCFNCLTNVGLPKGEDYLAVCTSDLQEIIQKRGSTTTNRWRLVDDIYWHTPDKAFEQCQCKQHSIRKQDRIQIILPASLPGFWGRGFRSPRVLPKQGAVLFGHSWRFPLRWKDHGVPEEGEPQEDVEDVQASFHDSTPGSSIASPGITRSGSSWSNSDTEFDRQQVISNAVQESERPPKRPSPALLTVTDTLSTINEHILGRPMKRLRRLSGNHENILPLGPAEIPDQQERYTMSAHQPRTQGGSSAVG